MDFQKYKENAMKKLEEAKKEGKADKPIYELLNVINAKEDYFTTSSCSGRILLLKGGETKKDSSFYKRWHRKIKKEELKEALEEYSEKERLWFRVQPFILHVVCKSVENGFDFIDSARKAGVKRIGMQRIKNFYLIELYGTESISIPLDICNCNLNKLVELSNKKMDKNEKRREKQKEELEKL